MALLRALQREPAPLFVLDTHAGAGHHSDLDAELALRAQAQEAADGIVRLLSQSGGTRAGAGDTAAGDTTLASPAAVLEDYRGAGPCALVSILARRN